MLEGGGITPIFNPRELNEVGYKLVLYPLSLVGVSIRAMQATIHTFFYVCPFIFPLMIK